MAPALNIGILGGTFDPIHAGHLAIAQEAHNRLDLDIVILVPAGRPWLKSGSARRITDPMHRLAMVRLAIEDCCHLQASAIELDRPGPTYTVDTLAELRRRADDASELYLILGMDSIRELGRWHAPERLFEMSTVVAMSRPDVDDLPVSDIERAFPTAQGQVRLIRGPLLDISATAIRRRVAEGRSIARWVPEAVDRYIREHRLYMAR